MLNGKNNKMIIIVMVILVLMVLGLSGYIIYDKVLKENENLKVDDKIEEENPSNDVENIDVSIKDNVVYVNGNKVDMYNYYIKSKGLTSELIDDEVKFYDSENNSLNAVFKYEIIDDIVFIFYSPAHLYGWDSMIFVDKDGNINYDVDDTIKFSGFQYEYSIDGKSIIIKNKTTDAHYEGQACNKVSAGLGNEVGITYYKVEYLGDNKFDIDKKYKELTYNDIVSDKDTFHFYCE